MKKTLMIARCLLPKLLFSLALFAFSPSNAQLGINITSPTAGQTVTANTNSQITVSTTGSVSKVIYWVDNWTWLGEATAAPYSFTYNFPLATGAHIIKARVVSTTGATVDAADRSFNIGSGGGDTQAPSVPGSVSSASVTQTSFTLNWAASTDNIGVTGYEIFRNGTSIGTSTGTSFNVTGLTANTAYSMRVRARDAAGNYSAQSTALNVTTQSAGGYRYLRIVALGAVSTYDIYIEEVDWLVGAAVYPSTNAVAGSSAVSATYNSANAYKMSDGIKNNTSIWISGATTYPQNITYDLGAGVAILPTQVQIAIEWNGRAMSSFRCEGSNDNTNWTILYTRSGLIESDWVRDATNNFVFGGGGGGDTQAPSVPGSVSTASVAQTSLTLNWNASSDNVGVTGYDVYRNGSFLASTTATTYSVTGLSCATAYSFYVRAKDAAGNQSANSTTVNASTSTCSTGSSSMYLGTNFWDPDWSPSTDYFVASPSFTAGSNPWNATFLNEIGIYKCLRFMDFGHVNNSNVTSWSQRTVATANQANGSSRPNGIAYEWMIDLCNRKGADLWVCLPHKTDLNYWTQLATLIKNTLNSNLKVYVEYSNETWNGGFTQFQYTIDQGVAQGLPGSNQYYQGGAYSVWQSVKIFKAFQDVFGVAAMGSRVIRVCSASGNYDIADQGFANILSSSTWNPSAQKADMFAIAPYVNSGDGASSSAQANFRAETDATYTSRILTAETIANKYAMQLGCYEGGQHLLTNAQVWSSNPAIYAEYIYMLNKWKPKFKLFNHYTHLGAWSSGGAWGAKQSTTSTLAESHKYRAMVDWVASNPGARPAATPPQVVAVAPASIETNERTVQSLVYPNPAAGGVITINRKELTRARALIFNSNGKQVLEKQLNSTVEQINIDKLSAGTYLLKVVALNGTQITERFVIQK